jgi:2-dehydro-3-deoxyphosphooctonate aldolase (KDO 8-P synthase)
MIYNKNKLLVITGPCSLESEQISREVAQHLARLRDKETDLNIVFKGSFDKANRTSVNSDRGTGIEEGLNILSKIKKEFDFAVLTDIHECSQAEQVGKVCDILQIPAFLCRQTDLLLAAAATGKTVNVKKGQFLAPQDMKHAIEKIKSGGASEVWQTERGTTFGYHNLVVDMRNFKIMSEYGVPVIFDGTHSVQLPGAGNGKSDGQREFVYPLCLAAIGAGADGLFVETHPDTENAISDGPNMIALDQLDELLKKCLKIWKIMRE